MELFIEAKQFDTELGKIWRGRAMDANSSRQLNFLLPIESGETKDKAEVATVYELGHALSALISPNTNLTLIVTSQDVADTLNTQQHILDLFADVKLKIEVADGSTAP